jgi:hypothetical protein
MNVTSLHSTSSPTYCIHFRCRILSQNGLGQLWLFCDALISQLDLQQCCIVLLRLYCLCIFIVPSGTLRLPWLRFFHAFSSGVRQMPGYSPQRRGTARNIPNFLCCSMYCLFCVVLCIVCVYMCTVLLPPGGYPIAVNKYIISFNSSVILLRRRHHFWKANRRPGLKFVLIP